MSRKLLRNCILLDPEAREPRAGALLLCGGRIEAVLSPGEMPPEDAEVTDLGGGAVAPGFVDLHFHGRTIFAAPDEAGRALRRDAAALLRGGTTSFLATTLAEPSPRLAQRVTALAEAAARGGPSARALGIHLEGPWICADAAGAQPRDGIRPPDGAELADLLARAEGQIRMVTLAPELPGAAGLQETLNRGGVLVALGHSLAGPEAVDDAVRRGARHVTHLFNAMGPIHHRRPGLAGAALADERLSCDLVCDGAHVDPRWVRVAARAKGDGLLLITDRIDPPDPDDAADAPDGAPGLGSGPLRSDGVALRLPDGRLAGSCLTLARAARNAVAFGAMTQLQAIRACTLRPARLLGLEAECGTLRRGARADLAVLDPEGRMRETWIEGRCAHRAPRRAG